MTELALKRCTKCGVEKPFGAFNRDKDKSDGLTCRCKDCRKPQSREWIAKKRADVPGYCSDWTRLHPERRRQIQAVFRARHPGRWNKWRSENPAAAKAASNRRRARMAAAGPRLEAKDILRLLELQRWRCVGCGKSIRKGYTLDHIVPLALGGNNDPRNLQMMCLSCNCSKHVRPQGEFMASRGFLL